MHVPLSDARALVMDYTKECKLCGSTESESWWKCCTQHTSQTGPDVLCLKCTKSLHPNYE